MVVVAEREREERRGAGRSLSQVPDTDTDQWTDDNLVHGPAPLSVTTVDFRPIIMFVIFSRRYHTSYHTLGCNTTLVRHTFISR